MSPWARAKCLLHTFLVGSTKQIPLNDAPHALYNIIAVCVQPFKLDFAIYAFSWLAGLVWMFVRDMLVDVDLRSFKIEPL